MSWIIIPLESIFPQKQDQPIFREEWREDLFYYLVSSLMVQVLAFLTFAERLMASGSGAQGHPVPKGYPGQFRHPFRG